MYKISLAIFTRSDSYQARDVLFPAARAMVKNPLVEEVCIIDKVDNEASFKSFFKDKLRLRARKINAEFSYDTYSNYKPEEIDLSSINIGWYRMDSIRDWDMRKFFDSMGSVFKFPIFNPPKSIIKLGSKAFLPEISQLMSNEGGVAFMPPLKLCQNPKDLNAFRKTVGGDIVVKAPWGSGGKDVFRILKTESDFKDDDHLENFIKSCGGKVLAVKYIHNPSPVDDRLVVSYNFDTKKMESLCAIRRSPGEGEWRCNLSSGGKAVYREPDERQKEIVRRLSPLLIEHGILLAGLDTLFQNGNAVLSEINVANVGALAVAASFTEIPYPEIMAKNHINVMHRVLNDPNIALQFGIAPAVVTS